MAAPVFQKGKLADRGFVIEKTFHTQWNGLLRKIALYQSPVALLDFSLSEERGQRRRNFLSVSDENQATSGPVQSMHRTDMPRINLPRTHMTHDTMTHDTMTRSAILLSLLLLGRRPCKVGVVRCRDS